MDLSGKKVILAVGQVPFELPGDFGTNNTFCNLVPLIYPDGTPVEPDDFPNNQLVWWMLRPGTRSFADPGRLLSGRLERSREFDLHNPDRAYYQVQLDSIEVAKQDDLVEIVTVNNFDVKEPRDLINRSNVLELDHCPTSIVLVRWVNHIYGPFRTTTDLTEPKGVWQVSLSLMSSASGALKFLEEELTNYEDSYLSNLSTVVTHDQNSPRKSRNTRECRYELLLGSAFKVLPSAGYQRIHLETDQELLQRLANRIMAKKKRQEFRGLLAELERSLRETTEEVPEESIQALLALNNRIVQQENLDQKLARALLESGAIDDKIEKEMERRAAVYISDNVTQLSAQISAKVESKQTELDVLEKRKQGLDEEISAHLRKAKEEVDLMHAEQQRLNEQETQKLEGLRQRLDEEQKAVSRHLEAVSNRFRNEREEVITQILALSSLLPFGIVAPQATEARQKTSPEENGSTSDSALKFPSYVGTGRRRESSHMVTELEFFDRFERHVKESGYAYRRLDLVSFHLSAKCCDLTILGGVSGTGKSTLPRLYAQALAGDEIEAETRHLYVSVSPSWLDMRDLVGHLNSLERRFQPSESGLYRHLINAQEEFQLQESETGIYLITLDEMNLSHVEHYFSAFLPALEKPHGQREVRCFEQHSVDPKSSFSNWPSLTLPPALRFIGTVNFDETTKQLSLRVLDRANLIRLRPEPLAPISAARQEAATVKGLPVRIRHYDSWIVERPLDQELARVLDELNRHLRELGCPITPRRQRAILRFVASAPKEVCSSAEALDLQISQRLLPQIRGLFGQDIKESLDALEKVLGSHSHKFPESHLALDEIRQRETEGLHLI